MELKAEVARFKKNCGKSNEVVIEKEISNLLEARIRSEHASLRRKQIIKDDDTLNDGCMNAYS